MLIEAMGNRSAGRGADPYCGGQHWPDEWDDWDEENEHYNPWSRPREVPGSIPPWHNIIERPIPARKHSKFMPKFKFIKDIDDEIAADWAEVKPHAKATGCYVSSDEYDSSKSSRDPLEGSGDTSDYSEPHKDEGETKMSQRRIRRRRTCKKWSRKSRRRKCMTTGGPHGSVAVIAITNSKANGLLYHSIQGLGAYLGPVSRVMKKKTRMQ
ncbi:hypothetical protein T484DRAFT_2457997 [Baffinella frigidus]|nr:hypothetical protein T484DRAFT_2457997 [Cryptophyta sp. CCMP2293]